MEKILSPQGRIRRKSVFACGWKYIYPICRYWNRMCN
jgi:hypothetical protein